MIDRNCNNCAHFAFICSPYRGNVEFNVKCAEIFCRWVVENNADTIPFAPHLYFTRFLDDSNESERNLGIKYGMDALAICDVVYVFKLNGYVTDGMMSEINAAEKMNKKIVYIEKKDALDILEKFAD